MRKCTACMCACAPCGARQADSNAVCAVWVHVRPHGHAFHARLCWQTAAAASDMYQGKSFCVSSCGLLTGSSCPGRHFAFVWRIVLLCSTVTCFSLHMPNWDYVCLHGMCCVLYVRATAFAVRVLYGCWVIIATPNGTALCTALCSLQIPCPVSVTLVANVPWQCSSPVQQGHVVFRCGSVLFSSVLCYLALFVAAWAPSCAESTIGACFFFLARMCCKFACCGHLLRPVSA